MGVEKLYTVYCHISPPGKMYFGITSTSVNTRWRDGKGYGDTRHFALAINKYGWDNIKHVILFTGLPKEMACEIEKALIKKYRTTDHRFGYNMTIGGECGMPKGQIFTEERKRNISKALTGKKLSEAHRESLRKSHMGIPSGHRKVVICLDLEGNELNEYESMMKAQEETGANFRGISSCCRGKRKTTKGFQWKFKCV